MNTMDLQAMGLTEMNAQEMQETDGGFWGALAWCVLGIVLTQDWDSAADAYHEGRNSVRPIF